MSVPAYKRQKPDPERPRDPEFVLLRKKLEAVADSDKRRYMAQEKKRKS